MIVYSNSLEDAHGLIQFFRSNAATCATFVKLSSLGKKRPF
jgi:hypothetical protein